MKKFSKLLVRLLVLVMTAVVCLSFTACEDIKKLEVTVSVYNAETKQVEEEVITIDLYRHLAPKTVDTILGYASEGYYDNSLIYKGNAISSALMLGDLEYTANSDSEKNGQVSFKPVKPQIKGEFENNGVKGSNLLNKEGSVSLFRTWVNDLNEYKTSDSAMDSGRATWFMPTSTLSQYDKYFCVFAQIDLTDEANRLTLDKINSVFATQDVTVVEYTVYYTGEYDVEKADNNYGLVANCVETSLYNEMEEGDKQNVFKPDSEKGEFAMYGANTIRVPLVKENRVSAASIKSIKVI